MPDFSNTLLGTMATNLTNKLTYKAFNAVTDPKANEFASKQTAPLLPPSTPEPPSKEATDGDPDTFSVSRFFKKIGSHTSNIVTAIFVPLMALILSMYVTNELIVYSAPIRLIFFIMTFMICFIFTPFMVLLAGYYLCKWGYEYYLNQLSNGPKTKVMPTIFAMLPLTTTIPVSSFSAFFMYPFTYPKNEKDAKQLPIIMNNYLESLKNAFTYFDKVQNLPFIAEGFKTLSDNIEHLHDVPEVKISENKKSDAPLPPTITPTVNNTSRVNLTPLPPTVSTNNAPLPPTVSTNNAPLPPTVPTNNAPLPPTVSTNNAPLPPMVSTNNAPLPPMVSTNNAPLPPTITPQNAPVQEAPLPPTVEASTLPNNKSAPPAESPSKNNQSKEKRSS